MSAGRRDVFPASKITAPGAGRHPMLGELDRIGRAGRADNAGGRSVIRAAEELARGSAKVAAIGAGVGCESEAAFSRAFKRATGTPPAAWRRARQHG